MKLILELLAVCLVFGTINADSNADLVNTKVERLIDLTSHLVYLTDKITVENTGSSAQKSYTYVVEPSKAQHVSIVTAQVGIIAATIFNLINWQIKSSVNFRSADQRQRKLKI